MPPARIDCHGLRYEDALRQVEQLVFTADRMDPAFRIEIITGVGDIRRGVIDLLDSSGYAWHHPGSNNGTIVVTE